MDTHHQEATSDAIAERERRGVLLPRVNLRLLETRVRAEGEETKTDVIAERTTLGAPRTVSGRGLSVADTTSGDTANSVSSCRTHA